MKIFSFVLLFLLGLCLSATPISAATCATHSTGDVDCSGKIDLADFELFRKEFIGIVSTTNADVNGDGKVTIADFEIWRTGYYASPTSPTPGMSKTPTPTGVKSPTPTTGGGSGGGTVSPGQSLSSAINGLRAGNTLIVKGGTYTETVTVSVKGTASAPIVIKAAAGERPIVKGLIRFTNVDYVILDGINVTWDTKNSSGDHMVRFDGGTGWKFINSEVWGARSYAAIHITGTSSGWTLSNLYVHDTYPSNSTNQDHLVYVSNTSGGIIERNLLVNSVNGRAIKIGSAGSSATPRNVIIRYNTMYNNLGPSNIQFSEGASSNEAYRNIMQKASQENVTIGSGMGSGNKAHDNVGWESRGVAEGSLNTGGNLYINPQFVSIGSNFRPQNPQASAYGKYAP